MTWRTAFNPGFVALRSFFQIAEELFILEQLPSLRDDGLGQLPHPEKLAAGLEEQILMEKSIVEQRAGLFPVAENHHRQSAIFRSRRGNPRGIFKVLYKIVFEEPVPRLAQLGLAALFIHLKMKLSLFMRRFCCHVR